jgi:hypothetical protein
VNITGDINAPGDFYEQRLNINKSCFDAARTLVTVCRQTGAIDFFSDPGNYYGSHVGGRLTENTILEEFRIGSSEPWRVADLAKFLRRRRFYFMDTQAGNALIAELSALKVSTTGQIEQVNDNRGNKRNLVEQAVKTDLPTTVWLRAPIYRGQAPVSFEVEIYIELQGAQVLCQLESPSLEQLRFDQISAILDGQIERFAKHDVPTTILEI